MPRAFDEAVRLERESSPQYYETHPMESGRYDPTTGTLSNDLFTGVPAGSMWVRELNGRVAVPAIMTATMINNLAGAGQKIWAGFNSAGDLTAIEPFVSRQNANATQQIVYAGKRTVPTSFEAIEGGIVRALATPALSVYVGEYAPLGWAGGNLVIDSGDIPSNANEYVWIVVYFTGVYGEAPDYVVTSPVVRPTKEDVPIADAYSVGIPDGAIRLAGVTLKNGQSTINYTDSRFESLRKYLLPEEGGGALTGDVLPATCQGRLTLESGVPVSTTDQTAKTTLYFTPFRGSVVALYDGVSAWTGYTFTERSLSLAGLTADTNYDVFLYDNAGTLTLEAVAWTNNTTRATALAVQDGVYVKSGATARRYLGTFRTTNTTGQCEDSLSKRLVWNAAQRVERKLKVTDSTNSHTYTTATWRAWNNDTTLRLEAVIGLNEDLVSASVHALGGNTVDCVYNVGIGLDSTSANSADMYPGADLPVASAFSNLTSAYKGYVGIGYHYLQWLQISQAAGTTSWFGDAGLTFVQSGMLGSLWA